MTQLSSRTAGFTDSVIRRMTRISNQFGAVNLSQGFPDFQPPQEILERLAQVTKEDFHQWAVREKGLCVGRVMLSVNRRFRTGTVAYYLAESTWGKGYMTEILRRVIDFCFDDLGLNRVEADHFARNPASGRVMEKAGMTREGLMRQKYCKDGEFLDAVLYAVLKEDRK